MDGTDQNDIYYPLDMLHQYAVLFPESSLTAFIDDYCRWFKLPLPEPDEEEDTELGEMKDGEGEKARDKGTKDKKGKWWRKKKGTTARERRKMRRTAGKEGTLAEDLEGEEREELVASMTVSLVSFPTISKKCAEWFRNCSTHYRNRFSPIA